jgi:hypothetical protein
VRHSVQRAGLVAFSLLTLQAVLPERARACSGFACRAGALLPAHMGQLPANAIELLWQPPTVYSAPLDAGAPAPVHLYKVSGSARTELAIEVVADNGLFRVKPKSAIAAGSELWFESEAAPCLGAEERRTFQLSVTPAAPAKLSRAGELRLASLGSSSMPLWVSTGECTLTFPVVVAQLAFTLDAAAVPFTDVLRHSLIVDGEERKQYIPFPEYPKPPIAPANLSGGLDDLIYAVCGVSTPRGTTTLSGDKLGTHTVQWMTRLQDGSELRSNELSVELNCPQAGDGAGFAHPSDAAVAPGDSDASVAQDAGAGGDLTRVDAARPMEVDTEAGAAPAAGTIASASEESAVDEASPSDGCSLQHARTQAWSRASLTWLYLVLTVFALRRRRA